MTRRSYKTSKKSSRGRKSPSLKRLHSVPQSRHGKNLSPRQQLERVRCLSALNRVRRGEARSVSAAARAEGTTLIAMRKLVSGALIQDRPGGRIRVKKGDRYSARVEVMTHEGIRIVTARGSRQRALAGQHRATFMRVLQGKEPPSALQQYRGKKVGGYELISDYELLRSFAQAGDVGQLETLYASPDASV